VPTAFACGALAAKYHLSTLILQNSSQYLLCCLDLNAAVAATITVQEIQRFRANSGPVRSKSEQAIRTVFLCLVLKVEFAAEFYIRKIALVEETILLDRSPTRIMDIRDH
jgi:hypothetical protein